MDINVYLVDCDTEIRESVIPNVDGSYTIFINARHSDEQQKIAYLHALKHIYSNDFEKSNVDTIESEAHSA